MEAASNFELKKYFTKPALPRNPSLSTFEGIFGMFEHELNDGPMFSMETLNSLKRVMLAEDDGTNV